MLARSQLNSTKSTISRAFIDNEISQEDFETIINVEKNFRTLKGSIRFIKHLRSNTEKDNLIEEGKRITIDKIIKHKEIINNNLKSQV